MNREGKLSLITFINLREMKSTNKKEIHLGPFCEITLAIGRKSPNMLLKNE